MDGRTVGRRLGPALLSGTPVPRTCPARGRVAEIVLETTTSVR